MLVISKISSFESCFNHYFLHSVVYYCCQTINSKVISIIVASCYFKKMTSIIVNKSNVR